MVSSTRLQHRHGVALGRELGGQQQEHEPGRQPAEHAERALAQGVPSTIPLITAPQPTKVKVSNRLVTGGRAVISMRMSSPKVCGTKPISSNRKLMRYSQFPVPHERKGQHQ